MIQTSEPVDQILECSICGSDVLPGEHWLLIRRLDRAPVIFCAVCSESSHRRTQRLREAVDRALAQDDPLEAAKIIEAEVLPLTKRWQHAKVQSTGEEQLG